MALLLAAPAFAQAPSPTPAAEVDQVVVTGSRIARRDFVATSPIVTQSVEVLQQTGNVAVEKSLQQLPQFAGGAGEGSVSVGGGGGGRATLNLRSLGAVRNLVLLDGRRLPPSGVLGEVDVNNVPQSMIAGVETITGGASAVYGSDAMSGVVNFKTRTNFTGIQLDAQYGNAFKMDRATRDINLTAGGRFADDKGFGVLSLGYTDREALSGADRKFYERGTLSSFIGYGAYAPAANNLPTQAAVNAIFATKYGVTTAVSRSNPIGTNDDQTLFTLTGAQNYRGRTAGDYVIDLGNVRYPYAISRDILNSIKRRSLYSKFTYDFTENLQGYMQVLYTNAETSSNGGTSLTQFGTLPTIPLTNPFIPADLRTILASRPNPTAPFDFNGRYVGLPVKMNLDRNTTYQFLFGIKGELPIKDWAWDMYASADRTEGNYTTSRGVLLDRVQSVFNSTTGGANLCTGGYNPFGDANARKVSQSCIDYLTANINSNEVVKQHIVEGSITGTLFALPAGDLKFSATGNHRNNSYISRPDSQLQFAGQVQSLNPTVPVQGETNVNEISGELLIPVIKDFPLIKALNLDAAYRYSDYELSGGVHTYKVDGDWTVIDGLMIRGGYARAIRAPNVGELFSAATGGQAGVGNPPASGEPCDIRTLARQNGGAQLRALCIATGVPANIADAYIFPTTATASVTAGNPNLDPEKADTFTVGAVLRPTFGPDWLSRLQVSVDYYNISIDKVIATINGQTAINKCYNQDGSNPSYSPTNDYCQLLHRDGNGQLDLVRTTYLNLGGRKTSGIDTVIDYRQPFGPGTVTFSSVLGYKMHYKEQTLPGTPFQDYKGTNGQGYFPKWQTVTSLGYNWGPASIGLRARFFDKMKDGTSVTRPASPAPGVKSYTSFDLNGSYQINEKVTIRGGVTNLADKQPLVVGGTLGNTNAGIYDIIGRSFFIAIKAKI
jgi:outer membrane receptor protein involved in Fe transport